MLEGVGTHPTSNGIHVSQMLQKSARCELKWGKCAREIRGEEQGRGEGAGGKQHIGSQRNIAQATGRVPRVL